MRGSRMAMMASLLGIGLGMSSDVIADTAPWSDGTPSRRRTRRRNEADYARYCRANRARNRKANKAARVSRRINRHRG